MRKLMWFAIGFLAACTFCAYFWFSGYLWCFGISLALAIGCGWLSKKQGIFAVIGLLLAGCALGFGWFWVYDNLYLADARNLDGRTAPAVITVSDYGEDASYGIAADGRININGKTYSVRVYLHEMADLEPSDVIEGAFSFRFTALGGSNEPTSQRTEGIVLYLYQSDDVTISRPEETNWQYLPAVWRNALATKLCQCLPADTADFACALLLGQRNGIDYATNTAFKVSGISHIIAVSGLHVYILFGLIYVLTLRRRFLTGIIGIPALILFAALVGFTPSVTRACIMQILMLLAMMTDKEYDPPTALAFSGLVMLIANPMTAASVSFQLSIGCMTGIFLFYKPISEWLQKRLKKLDGKSFLAGCKRWIVSTIAITISAAIITTPLVAVYFETISLIGVVTNLLTLWVISFVFYGLLLVCVFGALSTAAGTVVGWIVAVPIRYVIGVSQILSGFPLAAVYTKSIWIVLWLAICYGFLTWYILSTKRKPLLFGSCVVISLCIALMLSWGIPLVDSYRLTVLDVGQGQCILIQSEGKTFMVDCGGDREDFVADQAAEYLLSQGISRLDGVILTHYDDDHAGSVVNLLSRVPADCLYIPDISTGSSVKIDLMHAEAAIYLVREDMKISFGGAEITIFASETTNSGNESGLCILFRKEICDILITGDRGELGEMLLLHRVDLPELDVLVAGHHGSNGSTGEELLTKTVPDTVIISAGKNNPYGHPGTKLLERLRSWGCKVYRTDLLGTIIYRG